MQKLPSMQRVKHSPLGEGIHIPGIQVLFSLGNLLLRRKAVTFKLKVFSLSGVSIQLQL